MNNSKSKPVVTNLLRQNCYVRDAVRCDDLKTVCSESSYESLDEVVSSDGLKIRYSSVPYHITPEYVNSFADSSDYRKDPANAIATAPKRVNLGDITPFNDVASMDTALAMSLYDQLKNKFSNLSKSDVPKSNVPKSDVPKSDVPKSNSGEVK